MAEGYKLWKCPKCGSLVREHPVVAWRRRLYEEDPGLSYVSFAECPHCGATIEIEARTSKDGEKMIERGRFTRVQRTGFFRSLSVRVGDPLPMLIGWFKPSHTELWLDGISLISTLRSFRENIYRLPFLNIMSERTL